MAGPRTDLRALYEDRAAQQYAEPAAAPRPANRPEIRAGSARSCASSCPARPSSTRAAATAATSPPSTPSSRQRLAGVDIAERILETARARVEADLRQANLEALPFEDGEFDLVLCSQVIEHVLDAPAAVAELARVLRPGGTLVISTDNARNHVTRALNAPRTQPCARCGCAARAGGSSRPRRRTRARLPRAARRRGLRGRARRDVPLPSDVAARRARRDAHAERARRAPPAHGLGDILLAVARKP